VRACNELRATNFREAEACLDHALSLDRVDRSTYSMREEVRMYERAMNENAPPKAQVQLGWFFALEGYPEQAMATLEHARVAAPSSDEPLWAMGELDIRKRLGILPGLVRSGP
jgi:Tfp pilus assembly protein PilF